MDKTQGLTCPECSGIVPVKEGERLVTCPYCGLHSLIQGEQGTRRWQVSRGVERDKARQSVTGFFSGIKKLRDHQERSTNTGDVPGVSTLLAGTCRCCWLAFRPCAQR
ncbi:MAG: hypothetical protein HC804_14890 [Anaerolineae bacterium]|nr:hypothetical protein [Anaerolineae bacterium]